MAIDIKGVPPSHTQGTGTGSHVAATHNQEATNRQGNPAAAGAGSTDKVSLTNTAQHLRQVADHVAKLPVVDTQRVNSIKQALASGSYQIDSHRVAAKMMSFEKALG